MKNSNTLPTPKSTVVPIMSPVWRQTLYACFLVIFFVATRCWADVNDTSTERRLSSLSGPISLIIPREDWVITKEQRRSDDKVIYYMMTSEKRQLAFSVYIDKGAPCQSADACLDSVVKGAPYKDAQELERSTEGPFKVAQFYLDNPQGYPVKQAHILASAYIDGQWFDIHLSKTAKERPDRTALMEFLRTVVLK